MSLEYVKPGCAIDTKNNELLMTREFLVPIVIDALIKEGKEVSESNIEKMLDLFRETA